MKNFAVLLRGIVPDIIIGMRKSPDANVPLIIIAAVFEVQNIYFPLIKNTSCISK